MRLGINLKKNGAQEHHEFTWNVLAKRTILQVILGITCGAIASYLIYCTFRTNVKNEHLSHYLASHYAQIVQKAITDEAAQFTSIIQNKFLLNWNLDDDPTLLKDKINALKASHPTFEGFYIVGPEQKEPTPSQPELGYAALDMAQRAFSGNFVPPEIHHIEGKKELIDYVFPLRDDKNEIKAIAIVSQNASILQSLFDHYGSAPGFIELRDTLLGQDRLIAKSTRIEIAGIGPKTSAIVPGTTWQINFWLDPELSTNFKEGLPALFITLLLITAISGLIIWKNYQFLSRLILKDKNKLENMLQSLIDNNRPKSTGFHFRFANQLSKYMIQLGENPKSLKLTKKHHEEMEPIMDWAMVSDINAKVDDSIFRAYDIRGIVGQTLTPSVMHLIGKSVGSEIGTHDLKPLIFGRDGRLSGEELATAFCQGVRSTGVDIIDLGVVPTPLVYFGAYHLESYHGAMLTGSHNPPNYNGLKVVIAKETLAEQKIKQILTRIQSNQFKTGEGQYSRKDLFGEYIAKVIETHTVAKSIKVVVDAGNGVGGLLLVPLLKAMGCEVIPLFCDVDGTFPHHHPDPSKPENLSTLIKNVQQNSADLGLALDGDGDRLGVVAPSGNVIWPDRLLMLFAQDLLSRHPGAPILYDVKCSKYLADMIKNAGGKPIMCRTGHSLVKRALKLHDGMLAGEMSGHFFFKENWYGFDDACFAAVKLIQLIAQQPTNHNLDTLIENLPQSVVTPEINIAVSDHEKFDLIEMLISKNEINADKCITIDGLRIEFSEGWGLVRASNTTPNLVLRFEADNQIALEKIQAQFKSMLLKLKPELNIPF